MNFITRLRDNARDVVEEGGLPLTDAAEDACVTLAGLINEGPDTLTGAARDDGGAYLLADYGGYRITFKIAPDGTIAHTSLTRPPRKDAVPTTVEEKP